MPKKVSLADPIEGDETVQVVDLRCRHTNNHIYGTDGKLTSITCDLPKGHGGDHHAHYTKNVGEPVHDEKGRVKKVEYHEEEAETYWGDLAETPADQIQVGNTEQLSFLQKDLVLDILNRNPRLSINQATQQARALQQWNAADLT